MILPSTALLEMSGCFQGHSLQLHESMHQKQDSNVLAPSMAPWQQYLDANNKLKIRMQLHKHPSSRTADTACRLMCCQWQAPAVDLEVDTLQACNGPLRLVMHAGNCAYWSSWPCKVH